VEKLRARVAHLLDDACAVDNVGVIDVGEKLFEIRRPKSHVSFANHDQFGVVLLQSFLAAPIDTSSVSRIGFDDDARPCTFEIAAGM
jgi:hypothetical protein